MGEILYSLDLNEISLQILGLATVAMAFSPRIKREVREAQGGKCHKCGCTPCGCLEIHHRVPQALGGGDGIDNAVGLCGPEDNSCHQEADRRAFQGQIYPQVHSRQKGA